MCQRKACLFPVRLFFLEKDNKRFYGSKTFDKIAYEYEDAIKIIKEGFDNQSSSISIHSCNVSIDELSIVINYIINSGYYYVNNSYSYKSTAKMLFHLIRIIP